MCSLFRTVSSFLVLQNDNTLSESFGKISWSLLETMTVASHSFCRTWRINLDVKGFRSEKGMRLFFKFFFIKSCFSSPASSLISQKTNMSRNPHKEKKILPVYMNFVLHVFFISRAQSVFSFPHVWKAESESEDFMNLICLFENL